MTFVISILIKINGGLIVNSPRFVNVN